MAPTPQQVLEASARQSLSIFTQKAFQVASPGDRYIHNWHVDFLASKLEAVLRGDIRRLLVLVPPRSTKSLTVSVAFPAWVLGRIPTFKFIVGSTTQSLATKHSVDTRKVIESDFYRNLFPGTRLAAGENLKQFFATSAGGFRMTTSTRSTIIGHGADCIIIDDPHNPEMSMVKVEKDIEWARQLVTRLNDKRFGRIICVMQRLRFDDLAGYYLKQSGWDVIKLPAQLARTEAEQHYEYAKLGRIERTTFRPGDLLQPEREPVEVLDMLRRELGSLIFDTQYGLEPAPLAGNIVRHEYFRYFDRWPRFDRVTQSWDTALKEGQENDYSVCVTVGSVGQEDFVIDVWRGKLTYPELKKKVKELAERFRPNTILVEDTSAGTPIIQELRQTTSLPLKPIVVSKDKMTRLQQAAARFESGRVLFPMHQHFNADMIAELTGFPNCEHDDIVDAVSQYLNWRPHALAVDSLLAVRDALIVPQQAVRPSTVIQPNNMGAPAW